MAEYLSILTANEETDGYYYCNPNAQSTTNPTFVGGRPLIFRAVPLIFFRFHFLNFMRSDVRMHVVRSEMQTHITHCLKCRMAGPMDCPLDCAVCNVAYV